MISLVFLQNLYYNLDKDQKKEYLYEEKAYNFA